ncbi:MAG: hypothetical protein WC748_08405 [Legionellales bacterium]|jgi:tetratricopeptide (TPR) repeat protein
MKKYGLLTIIGVTLILALAYIFFTKPINEKTNLHAPLFDNLGAFHRQITTNVPLAQRYFDQGMVLAYGFEHGEAIRSFKEATRLDPNCAMCYWGLALALGNKMNAPMNGHEYSDGKEAIQKALLLMNNVTPAEQDYIKALSLRYKHEPLKTNQASAPSCHKSNSSPDAATKSERLAYVNAMKNIVEKYPHDNDAKALYGAALFFSNTESDPSYDSETARLATNVLKEAIADDPNHVGANHYFIHVTEPYAHPEDALKSAKLFKTLVPGSEHLVHMQSHIFTRLGQYHEAAEANIQATKVYEQYIQDCHTQGFEPEINYLYFHNYDFLRTAASMEGNQELALSAANKIVTSPFPEWLENDPSLQWFIPVPYFVQARFALWDEILKEPMPKTIYGYAQGMWHYARGMALANKGDLKAAMDEESHLKQIIQQGKIDSNLGEDGYNLLTIANDMLLATLANITGDEKALFTYLNQVMEVQDKMRYREPSALYFTPKQALGDAYLKYGHFEQAKVMYEEDLHEYPKNGWTLYGLAISLRALGDNIKADQVDNEFKQAWQYADVPTPILLFSKK